MDDLVVWLRQQLDGRERLARAVLADMQAHVYEPTACYDMRRSEGNTTTTTRVVVYDPARELREVDADRAILSEWQDADGRREYYECDGEEPFVSEACAEVKVLERVVRWRASVYSDRPGYLDEWQP